MICPLMSVNSIKPGIEDDKQEFIHCQEEKCQWYLRRNGRIEVFDCAIAALAVYNLPSYRGGE
ncbi:MAG: hypothetical protein ABRQ39_04235 [Candidatus Eremiobacterota bacterium]